MQTSTNCDKATLKIIQAGGQGVTNHYQSPYACISEDIMKNKHGIVFDIMRSDSTIYTYQNEKRKVYVDCRDVMGVENVVIEVVNDAVKKSNVSRADYDGKNTIEICWISNVINGKLHRIHMRFETMK